MGIYHWFPSVFKRESRSARYGLYGPTDGGCVEVSLILRAAERSPVSSSPQTWKTTESLKRTNFLALTLNSPNRRFFLKKGILFNIAAIRFVSILCLFVSLPLPPLSLPLTSFGIGSSLQPASLLIKITSSRCYNVRALTRFRHSQAPILLSDKTVYNIYRISYTVCTVQIRTLGS